MVNFKSLLEKATSPDLKEPDLEAILEIVEEIKGKNVSVKAAVKELRKRLLDPDPLVVYHTLCVLDSVMKNCASDLHAEVLSHEFMSIMKDVVTSSRSGKNEKAIDKALELIGEWKCAFGQQPGYKSVYDTFSELQREGYAIPETEVASAAFIQKAPEWVLGDRCSLCRQEFNRLRGNFRHHCRNCGKSVCATCSSKRTALTHFGIDQPTRVCDLCYKKHGSDGDSKPFDTDASGDLPLEYLQSTLAHESQQPPSASRNDQERMQEEDDLQIAIAMSLNEQENKSKQSSSSSKVSHTPTPPQSSTPSAPPPASTLYSNIAHEASNDTSAAVSTTSYYGNTEEPETDPNLAHYLNRAYWERRKEKQAGRGGPEPAATTTSDVGPQVMALSKGVETTPLADSVRKTLELFIQRMQEIGATGGSVATDPIVLSMYQNLNAMQPQLLKQIDEVQQRKAHQEQLLQKINEAKEARASLNAMKRQHLERIRQQEQEQAILGRMQMEQKLALLRQQKQEQLVYQQSLQHKRLEAMSSQRTEYERQIQIQREMERQQLIAQEQQVLQQQFGGGSPQFGTSPVQAPAHPLTAQFQPMGAQMVDPSALPMHTLSLHDPTYHQAQPLPSKLDHNPSADPSLPPPYQPMTLQTDGLYQPSLYQPTQFQPPVSQSMTAPPPGVIPDTSLQPPPSLSTQPLSFASLQQPQALPPQPVGGVQPLGGQTPQSLYLPPTSVPSYGMGAQQFSMVPQQLGMTPQQPGIPPQQPGVTPHQPGLTPQLSGMPPQQPGMTQQTAYSAYQIQPPMAAPPATSPQPPLMMAPTIPPIQYMATSGGGIQRQESEPPLISFD